MKRLFILAVGALLALPLTAQNNLTLYNMKTVPQRFYVNPARQSDAKVFVGVPGISSAYFDFGLTTFKIRDILNAIETDNQGNNVFVVEEFAKGFKKNNVLSLNNSLDVLSFGLKLKKNYVFMNYSVHSNIRLSFPGDLFQFLAEGNGGRNLNRKFDFGFGFDALQYGELGFGYNREIIADKLTVGARVKFVKGFNVINTAKSELNFTTDKQTFDYLVQSDIEINTANSFQNFGGSDPFNNLDSEPVTAGDVLGAFFGGGNRGIGLDIGMEFTPTKAFTLSASITNLGRINWNTNTFNWKSQNPGATYTYTGLEIEDAFNFNQNELENALERIGDTITSRFDLNENNESFKTGMFAQFYLGGNYNVAKHHNAGILFHGTFYNKTIDPAITLSWNSRLTRILGISASYSVANNSFVNAGAGISLNFGSVQTYFVSDNLIGLFAHKSVNTVNLRTGMNLTFGRKGKKKGRK
ncbi:MAG: hypothetical protein JJ975_12230 [Bacteroidia bacterium]|nr:hypothetical protein [Bacteroidia bacterium]